MAGGETTAIIAAMLMAVLAFRPIKGSRGGGGLGPPYPFILPYSRRSGGASALNYLKYMVSVPFVGNFVISAGMRVTCSP